MKTKDIEGKDATRKKNEVLLKSNYSNNVLSLMELEDSKLDGNKVLYKDVLKPKTNKKFTLRIWVSDKYQESTDNLSLSFKVDVKGTTKDME